jgi:acyl carrier protein
MTTIGPEVREAVIREYANLTNTPIQTVESGYGGGLEFDSILGVEMSVGLEEALKVTIPEECLLKSSLYRSLYAYSSAIQQCVNDAHR